MKLGLALFDRLAPSLVVALALTCLRLSGMP